MEEVRGKQDLHAGQEISKKRKWYSLMDKIWSFQNLELAFQDVKKEPWFTWCRQCHYKGI